MLNFAPNIFIMRYLQAIHQLTDEIKQKATDYTLQGMAVFTASLRVPGNCLILFIILEYKQGVFVIVSAIILFIMFHYHHQSHL